MVTLSYKYDENTAQRHFYYAAAKRQITPPFAIYKPKTPQRQTLKAFLAKHKNKPNLAGFKTGDILVSNYYPTFFKVIGTSEKTLIIAPLKVKRKRRRIMRAIKAYERFLSYEFFYFVPLKKD